MGKSKLYDCLHCESSNSVCIETNVDSQGVHVFVKNCRKCGKMHSFDDDGKLIKFYSHSPTEPEFDTLQEGDYTECNYISEYKEILMKNPYVTNLECVANCCFSMKIVVYHGGFLLWIPKHKKTQLNPEEFLRRADNTFKK